MLKPTIFKVLWFALIFIQKYFSKTPIHLADEMPTSEGVRQGTSSQLVSLFFTLVKSLYMLPGERTEEMKKIRKTTIASVDALYNVEFSGNIIPHTWYGTIQTEIGKPDMNAIAILSEILYWHRPRESCGDGDSGETVLEKRFASDMLQLSYGQLNKKFHLSKAQCRRAMKNLERLGVIKRHLRDLETDAGDSLNNVMFIEMFSDRLLQLTFPDEATPGTKNVTRVSNEMDEVIAFDEHDKPAYACLATRIPTGEEITAAKLQRTERAEVYLSQLGFRDFRVRCQGDTAKIQIRETNLSLLIQHREVILKELKQYYTSIVLDLEVRK